MISTITTFNHCDVQGTIQFAEFPRLGRNIDTNGTYWNVHAIIGGYVKAVTEDKLHTSYKDTSGYDDMRYGGGTTGSGIISQTWMPYKYEIIGKQK